MVTKHQIRRPPRPFYLYEWRKFMGTKPLELAIALDIERQSYHRLEKNWWTISTGEIAIIAATMGIEPDQLWFPPPKTKTPTGPVRESIDDLLEDVPENIQAMALRSVRGMLGK